MPNSRTTKTVGSGVRDNCLETSSTPISPTSCLQQEPRVRSQAFAAAEPDDVRVAIPSVPAKAAADRFRPVLRLHIPCHNSSMKELRSPTHQSHLNVLSRDDDDRFASAIVAARSREISGCPVGRRGAFEDAPSGDGRTLARASVAS